MLMILSESQPIKIGKFYWNCIKILMDFYPILSEDLLWVPEHHVQRFNAKWFEFFKTGYHRRHTRWFVDGFIVDIVWQLMRFDSFLEWKDFNFLHFLFYFVLSEWIIKKKHICINAAVWIASVRSQLVFHKKKRFYFSDAIVPWA